MSNRKIFTTIWATITATLLTPVLAAHALPVDAFLTASSHLSVSHGHCILCGMTRAYLALACNDLSAARLLNPLCFFFYYGSLINAFFLLLFLLRTWGLKAAIFRHFHCNATNGGGTACKRSA